MHDKQQDRWDIFCNVIDNYGDIGVCWRLARQLASEHGLRVRLWIDDLASFRRLCPELDPALAKQNLHGVTICGWTAVFTPCDAQDVADVVIEAFACELPERYLEAMATRTTKPAWINLEYLSAEGWVTGCHRRASPHPGLPLTKYFFFPGFAPAPDTGGLLRETRLLEHRDAWQANPSAARTHFGLPAAAPNELLVSLFSYENPALPELLHAWAHGEQPIRCLTPQGYALTQIAACFNEPEPAPGATLKRGQLTVHALPFVRQEDYDLLLWSCDLNFVRGEDSFVRALWAARPLLWHIYPQPEDAHLPKLTAFLDHYCENLTSDSAATLRRLWRAWNPTENMDVEGGIKFAWRAYAHHLPDYSKHAASQSQRLARQADLTTNLVFFYKNLL